MPRTKQTAPRYRAPTRPITTSSTSNTTPTSVAASKAPKKKKAPSSSLYNTIVTVLIGPDHIKFGIHKALLCHHSTYFKAALTGRFREAKEGTVTLEDEDPEVFSRFNAWLYTGSFMKDEDDGSLLLGPALALCVFAEKRLVPQLHNAIIDEVIKRCTKYGRYQLSTEDADLCISAWERCGDSRLGIFLVDLLVAGFDLEKAVLEGRVAGFSIEFITQIAVRAQKAWRCVHDFDGYGLREEHCRLYHLHEEGDVECKRLEYASEDETEEEEEEEEEEE